MSGPQQCSDARRNEWRTQQQARQCAHGHSCGNPQTTLFGAAWLQANELDGRAHGLHRTQMLRAPGKRVMASITAAQVLVKSPS
jgi:hypothetical protein